MADDRKLVNVPEDNAVARSVEFQTVEMKYDEPVDQKKKEAGNQMKEPVVGQKNEILSKISNDDDTSSQVDPANTLDLNSEEDTDTEEIWNEILANANITYAEIASDEEMEIAERIMFEEDTEDATNSQVTDQPVEGVDVIDEIAHSERLQDLKSNDDGIKIDELKNTIGFTEQLDSNADNENTERAVADTDSGIPIERHEDIEDNSLSLAVAGAFGFLFMAVIGLII